MKPIGWDRPDLGSIDSCDTYATCNTHPFPSEGDLTGDKNVYVNPLDRTASAKSEPVTPSPKGSPKHRFTGGSDYSALVDTVDVQMGPPPAYNHRHKEESPVSILQKSKYTQVSHLHTHI